MPRWFDVAVAACTLACCAAAAGCADDADGSSASSQQPVECHVTAPTACPAPAPSYDDVVPVIAEHCLRCHDGQSENWPLTSYDHVASWKNEIRSQMLNCGMPPDDNDMSNEERALLLDWIRCNVPK